LGRGDRKRTKTLRNLTLNNPSPKIGEGRWIVEQFMVHIYSTPVFKFIKCDLSPYVIQQVRAKLATKHRDFQQTEIEYLRLEKYFLECERKRIRGRVDDVDGVGEEGGGRSY
jgi:hypothetical protein